MPTSPIIELRKVTKHYIRPFASPVIALTEVSLQVVAGEFVAVLGKSGSGKSTLLNLIAGLDRPTSGAVLVEDQTLERMSEDALAVWRGHTVGVVFQFFQLLPTLSILENVLLPIEFRGGVPRQRRVERARDLLERVGLADQADRLPLTLSGGQQQRAAIARALANDPRILIADEPTGNLDSRTALAVLEVFHSLVEQGTTLIVVTHDQELARHAQRLIRIADGALADAPEHPPEERV